MSANPQSLELICLYAAVLGYSVLLVFLLITWRKRITGRAAFIAGALTLGWFATWLGLGAGPAAAAAENVAVFAWIVLLLRALGLERPSFQPGADRTKTMLGVTALGLAGSSVAIALTVSEYAALAQIGRLASLLLCVVGLVVVEQLASNTRPDYRWKLRFMSIGVGMVFLYGFMLHADAVLFSEVDAVVRALQPLVWTLAVAPIALASMRNQRNPLNLNVSRAFVFRTGALIGAGGYLVVLGAIGFYVRIFDSDGFEAALIMALLLGAVAAVAVGGSTRVRARVKEAMARHLYEYKYDYRDEWLRVTREMALESADDPMPERVIRALGAFIHSMGGAFWRVSDAGSLIVDARHHVGWDVPISAAQTKALGDFFATHEWIIDLREVRDSPDRYADLELTDELLDIADARFVIPLLLDSDLMGIVVLQEPHIEMTLMWEDYDVIKVAAREAAAFLALQGAEQRIADNKQFAAVNQLAAFLVHDLKTIGAQLSLLVQNAKKHKSDPAFIDDMLKTTGNASIKINKLVSQLQVNREKSAEVLDAALVLAQVVAELRHVQPQPELVEPTPSGVLVAADSREFAEAVAHLVRNAVEATSIDGRVRLTLERDSRWVTVLIDDTGSGMSAEFVADQLFKPYGTSKGLSGMGIGVYQAREYFRSLGGDVTVQSTPGEGTVFTLRAPCAAHPRRAVPSDSAVAAVPTVAQLEQSA